MYKSRIWKWGLDKKLKGDEVLAILILKRDRDALHKPSEFRIRGQPVDFGNIKRYVKRNPSLLAKLRAGHVPSSQTTREVTCRTPSPPPSLRADIAPPTELQDVERVLGLFRDYVDGSFSSGAWYCEYDVDCTNSRFDQGDRSNDLFERIIASFALVNRCMMRGDKIDINSVLGPSFESLKEIVAAESPDFVARTVCLLWYLDRHHKHDLLRLVLNYLAGLVPIVLGPHHILAHIWRRLSATSFSDYYELSMRLYSLLLPQIEERAGPANFLTHLLYSDYVDCVFARQGPEDCEGTLSRHLARAEASGRRHSWLGDMALSHAGILAACKERQGRLDEAVQVLTGHMNTYSMTEEQEAAIRLELGVKYYRMGNVSAAIASLQSAARMALTSDADERLSMTALANLEKLLTETGRPGEAEQVHQYRMDRLAAFAEKSASISRGFDGDEEADGKSDSVPSDAGELPEWLWTCYDGDEGCAYDKATFALVHPAVAIKWTEVPHPSASPSAMGAGFSPQPDSGVAGTEASYYYTPDPRIP
ncbi:hypothetical protein ACRALDRAFT_1075706 [Sodiomyces alcalophilus JCM 7366]|uniref:uncharacterized protein n=1 Tax=Sodiomyces alcalophilus JCM 7366 TaxID=591952 RepID=UPI0039B598E7